MALRASEFAWGSLMRRLALMFIAAAGVGMGVWSGYSLSGGAAVAEAVQAAPVWQITTDAFPTVLQPGIGREGKYSIAVENIGGAASEGEVTRSKTCSRTG